MLTIGTIVLIDGTHVATVQYDKQDNKKVMLLVGKTSEWVERGRITQPGEHMAKGEAPAPANAAYRGVMQKALEKAAQ